VLTAVERGIEKKHGPLPRRSEGAPSEGEIPRFFLARELPSYLVASPLIRA